MLAKSWNNISYTEIKFNSTLLFPNYTGTALKKGITKVEITYTVVTNNNTVKTRTMYLKTVKMSRGTFLQQLHCQTGSL